MQRPSDIQVWLSSLPVSATSYLCDGAICPSAESRTRVQRDVIAPSRFCGCPGRTQFCPRPSLDTAKNRFGYTTICSSRIPRIELATSENKGTLAWADVRRIKQSCRNDSVRPNDVHGRWIGSLPTPMVVSVLSSLRGRAPFEYSAHCRCIRGSGLAVL